MKRIVFSLFLGCMALFAAAQPEKKTAPALQRFLNTDFMVKYRDLRIECESAVLRLQSGQGSIAPDQVFKLRAAYDQTATRANQLLENIKLDFLNDKKLKSIAEFPDMYSDGLRFKLQEISDYYNAHFMQALADAGAVREEVDGSATLFLIVELIGLVNGLTKHYAEIRREARFYNEKYLQEHLTQPYRWRYWDELSGGASRYEQFDRQPEYRPQDNARQEQIEMRLQRVNEGIQNATQERRSQNPDPSWHEYTPPPADSTPAEFRYENWSPFSKPKPQEKPAETNKPAPAKSNTGKIEEQ